MAKLLTPKLVLRGFEIFAAASVVGFAITLIYGNNLPAFLSALSRLHWGWLLAGLALASMDWIGGGLRLWVVAREVYPDPPVGGMILAGGMSAWAAYVTPLQSGAGPMMMYTMRRYGVPLPVAATSTLMTFIATVAFFAIAGPLAIVFGAGKSLGTRGNVLGLSLYDLFLGSLGVFAGLGVLLVVVIIFPRLVRDLIQKLAERIGRRSSRFALRLEKLSVGLDEAHRSVVAFNTLRGWLALFWAILLSGPSHANKLLAGYVTLRVLGIEVPFVDVLLLQTLITFLLYFAPTPGASGIAELMSAAVMSVYVPRELTPIYTLVWRTILSYYTIAFGFFIFSGWVRRGLKGIEEGALA
ncbi:MAG: flippase-like domain-containing protein [Gemmatimonadales bacterium]|nr:flippase-like domain-containing protein [Gemmatimonadales bacterium]